MRPAATFASLALAAALIAGCTGSQKKDDEPKSSPAPVSTASVADVATDATAAVSTEAPTVAVAPTPDPSASPAASPSPSTEPSPSPSPSSSMEPSPSPSPAASTEPSPSPTPSSSMEPSPAPSATPAPAASTEPAPAPSPSATPAASKNPRELPFNPYAHAKVGEWTCVIARAKYDGTPPDGALPAVSVWTWKVGDKSNDEAAALEVSTTPAIDGVNGSTRSWSKKETPKLEDFLGGLSPDEITGVEAADESRTVGGRAFACKKITVTTKTDKAVLWVCQEVWVNGIVAMSRSSPFGKATETLELEVAGFGSADAPAFGKTPADVAKDVLPK